MFNELPFGIFCARYIQCRPFRILSHMLVLHVDIESTCSPREIYECNSMLAIHFQIISTEIYF